MLVRYFIQGDVDDPETGVDGCFEVTPQPPRQESGSSHHHDDSGSDGRRRMSKEHVITLAQIRHFFPYEGVFHFRLKVLDTLGLSDYVWMDIIRDDEDVLGLAKNFGGVNNDTMGLKVLPLSFDGPDNYGGAADEGGGVLEQSGGGGVTVGATDNLPFVATFDDVSIGSTSAGGTFDPFAGDSSSNDVRSRDKITRNVPSRASAAGGGGGGLGASGYARMGNLDGNNDDGNDVYGFNAFPAADGGRGGGKGSSSGGGRHVRRQSRGSGGSDSSGRDIYGGGGGGSRRGNRDHLGSSGGSSGRRNEYNGDDRASRRGAGGYRYSAEDIDDDNSSSGGGVGAGVGMDDRGELGGQDSADGSSGGGADGGDSNRGNRWRAGLMSKTAAVAKGVAGAATVGTGAAMKILKSVSKAGVGMMRTGLPTPGALENLHEAASMLSTPLDWSDTSHLQLAKGLWVFFFHDQPFQLVSPTWRTIGFQSEDLRSDVQSTGILMMNNLKYFCDHYSSVVEGMARSQSAKTDRNYPLAIVANNLTLMLADMLELRGHQFASTRSSFWGAFEERNSLNELFCLSFRLLDFEWRQQQVTRDQFAKIIGYVRGCIQSILDSGPNDWPEFVDHAMAAGMIR